MMHDMTKVVQKESETGEINNNTNKTNHKDNKKTHYQDIWRGWRSLLLSSYYKKTIIQ